MRHGRLTIDVPRDWSDRSTLLFVGPPPNLPMKTAHTVRLPQPSVAVTFAQTKGENPVAEARAILDDELAGLGTMGVGLEVHGIEELDVPLGRGVLSTHRLSLEGVRLLQMQLVVVTGQMAVRAVASTGEPDKVAELKAVLASLSMEKQ